MTGILEGNDLQAISNYIKSGKCKNITLMLGAGVSTAAGIPDFRSPGTGLYVGNFANLARLNLPYPEAVFEINFFSSNPVPFYTLANELYPGKFRPTLTHAFIRLLSEHSLLSMCFTQNIDTLERRVGVPENKIVEAHGSFASQRCIKCGTPFDSAKIKEMVLNFSKDKVVPRCEQKGCRGLVKHDIVFFGEALPKAFGQAPGYIRNSDLLIVIGTSLTVHPFASLAEIAPDTCPRVLINMETVGSFGEREDDVILLDKCDKVIKDLCKELGWEEELVKIWEETADSTDSSSSTSSGTSESTASTTKSSKGEEKLEEEVAKLAEKIQKQMALEEVTSGISEKQSSTSNDNAPTEVASESAESEAPSPAAISATDTTAQDSEPVATISTGESAPSAKQESGLADSQKL
ncbi:NAD-dependent deacetylase sirtuin-2 [Gymnopus androsaceus JB14]|uniref:NAD-dependent protein deacetylase n=1 Tax=Gymnopus androsaceus JB14 TaxID=1447944 RepID=A0A6A4GX61_9AGAR|nr:NAD-dependent deacetylase sirtuin-2 [Gymnopus androsaceus JB14]